MQNKKCTKCNVVKPAECFSQNSSNKTGLHSICKECDKKRYREQYAKKKNLKDITPSKREITQRLKALHVTVTSSASLRFQPVGNKFDPCIYCGRASDGWDHVPSREYASRVPETQRFLYPSCRECNCSLSSRPLFSLKERLEFLYERYLKTYNNLVHAPEWSQDEINELEGNLKEDVERRMKNKREIHSILRNLSRI